MTTKYPAQIDDPSSLPPVIDNITPVMGAVTNGLRGAIISIEGALGTSPGGVQGSVRNRFEYLESLFAFIAAAGGDLSGFYPNPTVIAIQGKPLDIASISSTEDGYVLTWMNSLNRWQARPGTGGGGGSVTFSNDLSGNGFAQTVVGLQNISVANTTPVQSAVPVYDTAGTKYSVRQLTLDDLGPAFAISSFSGGSTVEVGATVTNPAFTASYSSTPASAQITNTDGTNSPKVLTTPFTSGTVTGAFNKTTIATVTFTLAAIAATTKTATTAINFFGRSFFGVGTAGATSATASGNNAVLVGATGTIVNHNLASSVVNTTSATQSPSNQKIYFLCAHTASAHTFKDQNGFIFAFNTPTTFSFINQNSSTLSYDLYESTNLLSTSFTITVTS